MQQLPSTVHKGSSIELILSCCVLSGVECQITAFKEGLDEVFPVASLQVKHQRYFLFRSSHYDHSSCITSH